MKKKHNILSHDTWQCGIVKHALTKILDQFCAYQLPRTPIDIWWDETELYSTPHAHKLHELREFASPIWLTSPPFHLWLPLGACKQDMAVIIAQTVPNFGHELSLWNQKLANSLVTSQQRGKKKANLYERGWRWTARWEEHVLQNLTHQQTQWFLLISCAQWGHQQPAPKNKTTIM